ncbi:MAG: hypothetical protein ABFC24_07930 [Methanoregulaceae archaeon]
MTLSGDQRSFLLFGVAALAFLAAAILAFQITGQLDIEERFHQAVGLPAEDEVGGSPGLFGFGIEGNFVSYGAILAILIIICFIAIRYMKGLG